MKINLKKLPISEKIELFNRLYEDISGKGVDNDTELAHVNKYEASVLRALGGSGTINPSTNLVQFMVVEEVDSPHIHRQLYRRTKFQNTLSHMHWK